MTDSVLTVEIAAVLLVVWRSVNVVMAMTSLALLLTDALVRKRLHLRARFYWEAVALLLVSIIWGTTDTIFNPPGPQDWNPIRTAIVSVALVYFIISTWRSRRLTRLDLEDSTGGRVH